MTMRLRTLQRLHLIGRGQKHRFPSYNFGSGTDEEAGTKTKKQQQVEMPAKTDFVSGSLPFGVREWMNTYMRNLKLELTKVPVVAKRIGLAGAIPFISLAPPFVYILPLPDLLYSSYLDSQATYAAVILSFLGGPHWGMAMTEQQHQHISIPPSSSPPALSFFGRISFPTTSARYVWSVAPCLLGWFALLLPPASKFSLLITSFALALAVDMFMSHNKLLPSWYIPLRTFLTAIAIITMSASLFLLLLKKIPQAFTTLKSDSAAAATTTATATVDDEEKKE